MATAIYWGLTYIAMAVDKEEMSMESASWVLIVGAICLFYDILKGNE